MDELSLARMKLAQLEEKAGNLLQEFLDAMESITTQRSKIDELVRQRPAQIGRLPNELLSYIYSLAISSRNDAVEGTYFDDYRARMKLAMVSRRWRDIILNTPKFWTTIEVDSSLPSPETHLERNRNAPLDVIIRYPMSGNGHEVEPFYENISCLISSAHRWRTLALVGDDRYWPTHTLMPDELKHSTFPSLKSVVLYPGPSRDAIEGWPLTYPDFLAPEYTPVLEHIELRNYVPSPDFHTADALKSLELALYSVPDSVSMFLYQISTESLTNLSLMGDITSLTLTPNSIQFPFLHTLSLQVVGVKQFLEAIDAPNLTQFVYVRRSDEDRPAAVFGDLGSKFNHVHRLSFSWAPSNRHPLRDPRIFTDDAVALSRTFPCVYHAEVDLRVLFPVFDNHAESWKCLQSLTFDVLHSKDWFEGQGLNRLVSWLKGRQELGLPPLRLKFTTGQKAACSDRDDGYHFGTVYNHLQKYCILELEDFLLMPDMYFSVEENSPRVVSAMSSANGIKLKTVFFMVQHMPYLTSPLMNDIGTALWKKVFHTWSTQF